MVVYLLDSKPYSEWQTASTDSTLRTTLFRDKLPWDMTHLNVVNKDETENLELHLIPEFSLY